jgi:two-component system, cell cycle sensor histidine kinase and response regulator CckA
MTMPIMSGAEAITLLKQIRPGVPVIVSSGYSGALAAQHFAGKGAAGFIQKPYTAGELASKIQFILSRKDQNA